MINLFLPTTPNPTSGFYLVVAEEETIPLSISVEDAFKLLISGGVVEPGERSPPFRFGKRLRNDKKVEGAKLEAEPSEHRVEGAGES
jgi:uncharacterized membrane protein